MKIYTEVTPNPESFKFVVEKTLLPEGVADFDTPEAAVESSDLAGTLFAYPFVKRVFFGRNFVTVTKSTEAQWENVIPVVKDEMTKFLLSGEPILKNGAVAETTGGSELDEKIRSVIDEQVRPAVAMDGGDIIYEGTEDGVVRLKLRGSCSGCPSSTATLKFGIQNLLVRLFPNDVKSVEAVNG